MVFVADNGAHLVKELEKLDIPARTIGVVQKGIKREICYGQVRGSWTGLKRMRYMRSLMRRQFYERKNFSDYGKEQQN